MTHVIPPDDLATVYSFFRSDCVRGSYSAAYCTTDEPRIPAVYCGRYYDLLSARPDIEWSDDDADCCGVEGLGIAVEWHA